MKKRTLKYLFLIAAIMFCVSSNTKVQAASDFVIKKSGQEYILTEYKGRDTTVYVPKKVTIINGAFKNNKKIKLKFKKIAGAKGYEIKYSTSKKFGKKVTKTVKTKNTTKMLSKLKKKTYYIKVRAYKVVEGKTYNSKWSSVKKVRTRK